MTGAIVGISGSPSVNSRSRILLADVVAQVAAATGQAGQVIDLSDLDADALLARRSDAAVAAAIASVTAAKIVVIATPIYRATYTGLLKVFLDLFPQAALRGSVVGLIATGAGSGHSLAIDHGLRPVVASLAGLSAANALYVTDSQFPDKAVIPADVAANVTALVTELRALARSTAV